MHKDWYPEGGGGKAREGREKVPEGIRSVGATCPVLDFLVRGRQWPLLEKKGGVGGGQVLRAATYRVNSFGSQLSFPLEEENKRILKFRDIISFPSPNCHYCSSLSKAWSGAAHGEGMW